MKRTSKTWMILALVALGALVTLGAQANARAASQPDALTFDVSEPVSPILSEAVRDLVRHKPEQVLAREVNPFHWLGGGIGESGTPIGVDSLTANSVNGGQTPLPLVTFEGVPSLSGVTPPDTNGDVGPNHYIQMTNFSFQIWDKGDPDNGIEPSPLIPPTPAGELFAPLGGQCTNNFGDPVVLYDDLADRWVLTQFGLSGPLAMCFAISTTPDPLGTYYLYEIPVPDFPDYPKIGMWPDAYYMGTNTGFPNAYYVHAFDRVSMLAGEPATRQSFGDLANLMMPADADGQLAPPTGDPGIFYTFYHPDGQGHPAGTERLALYEFDVDWGTPANSTFTLAEELAIAPFNYTVCGFFAGGCIEQPGTGQQLDDLSWWPMFRFQYRNFGGYAAMVGNFTVDPDDTNRGAIRWFEVHKTGSTYTLHQEGTYDPDTDSRWMGSIAMDISGNVALGYSVSSGTTIPSIRYATRLAGDPLGTLSPEAEMWSGGGVQTDIHRWGDYSNMTVDPVDGCTFWFTTEYHDVNDSGFDWNTRIGVFRIPSCGGPHGTLSGEVTDSSNSQGIPDASIRATASITKTGYTLTDPAGIYTTTLLEGTYVVTATAYGYYPGIATGVDIISGTTTVQDFALDPAPTFTVSGQIIDADTGWPLYAKIDITGYPGGPVWTDPLTGEYSVGLAGGSPYTFKVTAWTGGYAVETRPLAPLAGNQTEDFALTADLAACTAPGYVPDFVFSADFEAGDGGFTVGGSNPSWEWGQPTSGPGGAHSGQNAWATNLAGNYNDGENSYIISPEIDLSAFATEGGGGGGGGSIIVSWWQWLQTEQCCDFGSVEVSNDGGGTWTPVFGPIDGQVNNQWTKYTVYLDSTYAVSNFMLRFVLTSDGSVVAAGFYVDDVGVGAAVPPPNLYAEDFETNNGSYLTSGVTSWEWGTPTRGPSGAYSGDNAWGTDLDDDYGNNENGYLTSAVIDLTGFNAAAQALQLGEGGGGGGGGDFMLLSWFQWLQTEQNYDFAFVDVTSDGFNWTQVYTTSGIVTTDWIKTFIELDASYATPEFQVRFGLQTDGTVTYPGFYVDGVSVDIFVPGPPVVPCEPLEGGLVSGYVYDQNTLAPLNGATVASTDGTAYTQSTPDDDALSDGFYIVFAEDGIQPVTASLAGYGSEEENPTVPAGGAVWQEFNLPAGLLVSTPNSLQVTVALGGSTTSEFVLGNTGNLAATFQIKEKNGSFTPASLQPVTVPGYTPAGNQPASYAQGLGVPPVASQPFSYLPPAGALFSSSSSTVLIVGAGDASQIQSMLLAYPDLAVVDYFDARIGTPTLAELQAYDTVIVLANNAFSDPVAMGDVLADYVDAGGTVVQTVPTFFDPGGNGWGLQGRFMDEGYSPFIGTGDWFSYAELGAYDPGHPIMAGVTFASDSLRQVMDLSPKAELVASWTDDEFVAVQDQVVALNTFIADGYAWGGDIPLIVHNSIIYLQTAGDVPWLSTEPITGTVEADGSVSITVAFDASVPEVVQPGDYTASVVVKNSAPYGDVVVPVTMTVNAPEGWGSLTGIVTGLGYCDAGLGALNQAIVDIAGVASTESNANGLYTYWLDAGTYSVTVSLAGYVSQTFNAVITAGGTATHDVALRLDVPCADPPASQINLIVAQGGTADTTLTLGNTGAGDLVYAAFESLNPLGAVSAPGLPGTPAGFVPGSGLSGPASIRTLSLNPNPSEDSFSGWFSATDHPEGVIRYASAQCYEQPDSYYVMSGIDGITFGISTSLWRFDTAANGWTQLADLPAGHEAPVAACYQGKIYLLGGDGTDEMYVYDINQDAWGVGATLPRAVEGAAAAAWDGQVFLIGGDDDFFPGSGISDEVNIYDIATDTWVGSGTPMVAAVSNAGFAQVGQYVYIVGGWGVDAPALNSPSTQRYDLANDAWGLGPAFDSARADFALAATAGSLVAIGGDEDGGFFFEAVNTVETLDLSAWPGGAWVDPADPIPVALQANNAGFCTQGLFDPASPEVWSVGGLDTNFFVITGRTLFQERPGESCYSIYSDVPWLSVDLPSGIVPGGTSTVLTVTVDAADLLPGEYTATIVIVTNDPENPQFVIPVTVTVTGGSAPYQLYLPVIVRQD